VTGVGRFTALPEGEDHPVVALIDCPGLDAWRAALILALVNIGLIPDATHGFLPHATLAYVAPDAPTPVETLPPLRIVFTELTLAVGSDRSVWALEG
jgi:hypothetical protein